MPHVLIVGSANVDFTVVLARLPGPGETVSGGRLLVNRGGKGANQAVAARRLGADVRFVGCVGDDASGRDIVAALSGEGIGVDGVITTSADATGTALIVVDAAGRNQIAVAPGANRRLPPQHVAARAADFAWAEIVLCQLETPLPTVRRVLEEARRHGVPAILNPAPVPDEPLDCLALADVLTPNETEVARLAGVPVRDAAEAAHAAVTLRARGVGRVVVTLGAAGALACDADGVAHAPAFPVDAVDTTSAGDAFNAGLAVGLAGGRSLSDALRLASATAALACTRHGAQASMPTAAEVSALLASSR